MGVNGVYYAREGKYKGSMVAQVLSGGKASFSSSAAFFFFSVLGREFRAYTFSHSTSSIFVQGFFKIGSRGTICLHWLRTMILLISAS
jgi:hypothetical protein